MKRIGLLLPFVLLLAACGEETLSRAETLQQRFAACAGYEATVRAAVAREDETLVYTLRLSADGEAVRAEVIEPAELAGITASMTGDALMLSYDAMLLDALSLSPRVSALSCAPLLLDAFPEAYLESCGAETLHGAETLRADFPLTLGEESFACTLFFGADDTPLYGEIAQNEKIIAAVEFTSFAFSAILVSDA